MNTLTHTHKHTAAIDPHKCTTVHSPIPSLMKHATPDLLVPAHVRDYPKVLRNNTGRLTNSAATSILTASFRFPLPYETSDGGSALKSVRVGKLLFQESLQGGSWLVERCCLWSFACSCHFNCPSLAADRKPVAIRARCARLLCCRPAWRLAPAAAATAAAAAATAPAVAFGSLCCCYCWCWCWCCCYCSCCALWFLA